MRVIFWVFLVLLLFTPMVVEFSFISANLTTIQRMFPYWKYKPVTVVLSDILFIEAGALIVFGALFAGAVLYNTWASMDIRQLQFTAHIWNRRKMKEERDLPTGLVIGLTILAVGIIYMITAVITSFGIIPIP